LAAKSGLFADWRIKSEGIFYGGKGALRAVMKIFHIQIYIFCLFLLSGFNKADAVSAFPGAEAYYTCTSPIASDLDGNCQVDSYDYAIVANVWAMACWTS
jgi:hypothetical protein